MSAKERSILDLIGTIRNHLQQRKVTGDAVGKEIAKVLSLLEQLPPLEGTFSRSTHPSTRHLDAAFDAMQTHYGTIETYFASALGIGAPEQETLRRVFLTS